MRSWNTRLSGSGFQHLARSPQMLIHTKPCLIPIFMIFELLSPLYSWATSWENLFCPMRTTKARISTFVVRCLDSIHVIPQISISEISSLYIASVAAQAGLCLTRSQSPKTGFLVSRLSFVSFLSLPSYSFQSKLVSTTNSLCRLFLSPLLLYIFCTSCSLWVPLWHLAGEPW